ncbi:MAG: hypothetical protein HY714_06120 [Candidatus Omnitrophica bacterium]|nr:hypothetical protein [Candidatus Omnitrophota bacterium]
MKPIPVVALATFLFHLSACAFGSRQIPMSYPPQSSAGKYAVPAKVRFPPETVTLVSFADERPDRKNVGNIRSWFKVKMVEVPPERIAEWISQALVLHLEQEGYRVVRVDRPDGTEKGLVLSGGIARVNGAAFMTYEGTVELRVRAAKDGRELFDRVFRGRASAGGYVGGSEDRYQEALSLALENAVSNIVRELKST